MKRITQEELNKILEEHRLWFQTNGEEGTKADLSFTILRKLDLREANLTCACLNYIDLSGANLSYADLSNANLRGANLTRANLTCANLSCVDLDDANLEGAKLSYSNLSGANLRYSNLSCASLRYSNLNYIDLSGANLKYVSLNYANLVGANLTKADLTGTDLSQTSIQNIIGLEIYSIDNIGTFNGKVTYIPKYDRVYAGCWGGNLEEFLEKGLEMNEENNKQCTNIVLAYQFFKNQI